MSLKIILPRIQNLNQKYLRQMSVKFCTLLTFLKNAYVNFSSYSNVDLEASSKKNEECKCRGVIDSCTRDGASREFLYLRELLATTVAR